MCFSCSGMSAVNDALLLSCVWIQTFNLNIMRLALALAYKRNKMTWKKMIETADTVLTGVMQDFFFLTAVDRVTF